MEQIQFIVTTLADNYGFDATEALDYVLSVKREKSPAYARALKAIATTNEKIAELEQKIANGKVRKPEKSQEKLASLREKLETQEEKLEDIGKPKERKPRAPKVKEEVEEEKEKKVKEEKPKKDTEEKPKKVKEEKAKEVTEEKAGKRISRMSPMLSDKLKATFGEFDSEMSDKTKKGFVVYVNDLTKDDFDAKTLTEHMRDYAVLTVRPTEEAEATTLELKQLLELKNLIDGYSAGIYWDPSNKRFVTGQTDDDEDVIETTFNEKDFMVGDTTGRVYENIDDEDIFVGYKGIGQFKGM
jgi:hypothetical protein